MKEITIKELSQNIGISSSTISRVLTGRGYVKPQTREIVEAALKKSGYRHNPSRTKTAGSMDLVLILCGDLASQVYVQHIRGISSVLEAHGYKVVVADFQYDADREEEYLHYANSSGKFCGAIMLSATATRSLEKLLRGFSYPIVLVNRYLEMVDTDIVCMDNYRCGYMATRYLIDHGHRRIAHLAGPENSTSCHDRMRGYVAAMRDAELEVSDADITYADLHADAGRIFARSFAAQREGVTAVFVANDVMAHALAEALIAQGLTVPGDVSIICVDNTDIAVSGHVAITAVAYDNVEMGATAGEMLLARMRTPDKKTQKIVYAPILIERDSVTSPNW